MNAFRLILAGICTALFVLTGILLSRLMHVRNEERFFEKKVGQLADQEKQLNADFQLKQDYMRKMISDQDVIERTIREKTGLSKPNEVIIKFDD